MQSKRFTLNKSDLLYTWDRAKLFLLPLVLIYVGFLITKVTTDGFQLSDFYLSEFEQGALVLYILNRITTAGKLFIEGKK